jgi:hypothetical protein
VFEFERDGVFAAHVNVEKRVEEHVFGESVRLDPRFVHDFVHEVRQTPQMQFVPSIGISVHFGEAPSVHFPAADVVEATPHVVEVVRVEVVARGVLDQQQQQLEQFVVGEFVTVVHQPVHQLVKAGVGQGDIVGHANVFRSFERLDYSAGAGASPVLVEQPVEVFECCRSRGGPRRLDLREFRQGFESVLVLDVEKQLGEGLTRRMDVSPSRRESEVRRDTVIASLWDTWGTRVESGALLYEIETLVIAYDMSHHFIFYNN